MRAHIGPDMFVISRLRTAVTALATIAALGLASCGSNSGVTKHRTEVAKNQRNINTDTDTATVRDPSSAHQVLRSGKAGASIAAGRDLTIIDKVEVAMSAEPAKQGKERRPQSTSLTLRVAAIDDELHCSLNGSKVDGDIGDHNVGAFVRYGENELSCKVIDRGSGDGSCYAYEFGLFDGTDAVRDATDKAIWEHYSCCNDRNSSRNPPPPCDDVTDPVLQRTWRFSIK